MGAATAIDVIFLMLISVGAVTIATVATVASRTAGRGGRPSTDYGESFFESSGWSDGGGDCGHGGDGGGRH